MINVTVNQSDLLSVRATLAAVGKNATPVLVRSINKTIPTVQTEATKRIGAKINLPATRIKQDFIQNKASADSMSASLAAKGKKIGLISFTGTRMTTRGVSVKVYKDLPRIYLKHAFIATAKTAQNVWQRVWHESKKPLKPGFAYGVLPKRYRLPVFRLEGPSVEDAYEKPEIFNPTMQFANDKLAEVTERELQYELGKL